MDQTLPTFQPPTPLQTVRSRAADEAGVQWLVKRDDLIHPQVSGNKWRKLKYNLVCARRHGFKMLATFGGAYSNHLYATAAAGQLFGFQTLGIVRGDRPPVLSPTLRFVESCGMQLEFWPREAYRLKEKSELFQETHGKYAPFYLIPEGGTNALALRGCAETVHELDVPFDWLTCACGTGGTLAGLVAGATGRGAILGFAALKGGHFLTEVVQSLLADYCHAEQCADILQNGNLPGHGNWQIQTDYHFGGYAKHTPQLRAFMHRFEHENGFPVEQVYTAKMFFGVEDLMRQGFFRRGQTIVSLHTGGLQGRIGQADDESPHEKQNSIFMPLA